MASKIGWYHGKEKRGSHWHNRDKVGVQADECADSKEGEGMRRCTPCEETLKTVLEDKYYSDPTAVSAT